MVERRLSEKEVALVLRRAAEIDASGTAGSGALTPADVEAIGQEAGIRPEAVRQALMELRGEGGGGRRAWLAPASRRTTRHVSGELTRAQLQRLVRAVEDRAGRPGSVSEALGTVRWTSAEPHRWTTQVTFSAEGGETRIAVHERAADGLRQVFHALPGLWGGMLGLAAGMTAGLAAAPVVAFVGAGAAIGFGIGRSVFAWRSRESAERVESLARGLEETARASLSTGGGSPGATAEPPDRG